METKDLGPQFGQEYIDFILEIAAMKKVWIGDRKYLVSTHGSLLIVERGKQMGTYGPNSIHDRFCRNDKGEICYKQRINGGAFAGMGGTTKLVPLLATKIFS